MDVSPVVLAALESSDLCRRLVDESGQPLLTSAAFIQLASNLQWLERSGGEVLFRQGENGQSFDRCVGEKSFFDRGRQVPLHLF